MFLKKRWGKSVRYYVRRKRNQRKSNCLSTKEIVILDMIRTPNQVNIPSIWGAIPQPFAELLNMNGSAATAMPWRPMELSPPKSPGGALVRLYHQKPYFFQHEELTIT